MLKVGLLGAGIGAQHVDGFLELPERFEVTSICDLDRELAEGQAERCGARVNDKIAEVLEDPEIDIIDISLPPGLHVPVSCDALAHDKHVILEKPIAGSLAEADRLREAALGAKSRVFPVFQYRYGRAFAQLQRLEAAGLLGKPLVAALETHWNRGPDYYANPWRGTWEKELGGVVLSHAIHAHDLMTRFFGPVADVSAMLTTRANPIETEDCAAIAFRMENGAVATSSITLGAATDESRFRFVFADLTAQSGTAPYRPGMAEWTFLARDPARQAEVDRILAETPEAPQGYAGYFAAIADALEGHPGDEVTLADGLASIELVTAIYEADRAGHSVALPVDRSLPIIKSLRP